MTVPERLSALRKCMEEKNIDVYVVPTADYQQREYVEEHFKASKFITGFSGTADVTSSRQQHSWRGQL